MRRKRNILLYILLFFLLTTFIERSNIEEKKNFFTINKIVLIENNFGKSSHLKNELEIIKGSSIINLKQNEVNDIIKKFPLISYAKIDKVYPSTLKIEVFEKKIIGQLFEGRKKFYVDENGEMIITDEIEMLENKAKIFGGKAFFYEFYKKLKFLNFPVGKIDSFYFFEIGRWDLKMSDGILIKLPTKNYEESLKNFLKNYKEISFKNFKVFDYRIKNELILK